MYIKVRKLGEKDGVNELVVSISKKAKIQELRAMIFDKLNVEQDRQRLFYKGKQLIDDHSLVDYNVQLNDVIQLMICQKEAVETKESDTNDEKAEKIVKELQAESKYYKVGDYIDMRDIHGAWFEAKLVKISKKEVTDEEKDLIFYVVRQSELERAPTDVKFNEIRPRSYKALSSEDFSKNLTVLVNYNIDDSKELGYWYDFKIAEVKRDSLKGTILFGTEKTPIDDCLIKLKYPVYQIETPTVDYTVDVDFEKLPLRKIPYNCLKCKDVPSRKCYECGCKKCGGKNNWDQLLLCDECNCGYHIGCLNPPLLEVPDVEEWYCPDCKTDENEIVKAGDKLKFNKKKANMPSAKDDGTSRDWGRGMACVGRTMECTLVNKDHIGPIPGVDVGTCWKYRLQVSEAGVHRPLVAGIHGTHSIAYSIVLSGGYEDDIDNGDEFYYTGSGGRDLSGNKRVSEQSHDQVLTRLNKALAMNCNAKFNPTDGAEAEKWQGGKPVRVVRNYKAVKHSKYAPQDGNRYDGIYKVVKYYPEKGKSGFIVWRYLLRRDDPNPAPWHKDGKEHEMVYPPGYLEAQASKEKEKQAMKSTSKRGSKRVLTEKSTNKDIKSMFKKAKTEEYELEPKVQDLIIADKLNEKLWSECKHMLKDGKTKFLNKVEEVFMCICCQELVHIPVTTTCKHNICKSCLKRSFKSEIYTCPHCRFELGKEYKFEENESLGQALLKIFPGYDASRNS